MSKKVIDISSYQGILNWAKLSDNVAGYIHRLIVKNGNKDSAIAENIAAATVPLIGVYVYCYSSTDYTNILSAYKSLGLTCPIYLDWENAAVKETQILYLKGCLEDAEIDVRLYSGMAFYAEHVTDDALKAMKLWVARYPYTITDIYEDPKDTYKPTYNNVVGWQYTSKTKIDGLCKGNIDVSIWYDSVPETEGNPYEYPTRHYWYNSGKNQTGDGVRWIQWHLQRLGFYTGSIDGIFGVQTHAAVINAQSHYGFWTHGVVESETRNLIQYN